MIHFDLPKQKSSIIKVLGVGGGGSNAVNYMYAQDIEGVDFVICNTDAKALEQSRVPNKIQLGPHLTQGLGAGANPEVGKQATEESLEEIRKILEVNTKMAFITAGMGGGTGTGGAPIISKICRDLNILTVGIVTTPFAFEGPRRLKQAEEGIRQMQPYVDTLLVISNDKLRIQYGNLKMTEAFAKADNVLATAAKCITDIINSRGTIIVDFADVCTVMKNGGVAILGSATAEGEDRAQQAIEQALSSPLLNDNDIRGAKWILVNINSGQGENECTMDEFEIINNYLLTQAGDNTDLIIGTGYDTSLGNKIGITIIATGFEFKDPFTKKTVEKKTAPVEEKILMTLGVDGEEKKMYDQQPLPFTDKDPLAPKLEEEQEEKHTSSTFVFMQAPAELPKKSVPAETIEPVHFELFTEKEEIPKKVRQNGNAQIRSSNDHETKPTEKKIPAVQKNSKAFLSKPKNIYADASADQQLQPVIKEDPVPAYEHIRELVMKTEPVAEQPLPEETQSPVQEPLPEAPVLVQEVPVPEKEPENAKIFLKEEPVPEDKPDIQLVIKEEEPPKTHPVFSPDATLDDLLNNEEEEQKRRAAERISKLRNLSFNMNSSDGHTEYDNVPAYVRRNMELFGNTLTSVEQFYSKYTVKKDENEEAKISTINTFLDGKKPD